MKYLIGQKNKFITPFLLFKPIYTFISINNAHAHEKKLAAPYFSNVTRY